MSNKVYPLYTTFTDTSSCLHKKNELLGEFKKHVKRELINVIEIPQYFDAFLYLLYDHIEDMQFQASALCEEPNEKENVLRQNACYMDDGQKKLITLESFKQNLYATFCHLIKRASMQSPISLNNNLLQKIIVVLLKHDHVSNQNTLDYADNNNNSHNNNNNTSDTGMKPPRMDINSKKALIGLYLAKNEIINEIFLNDIFMNEELPALVKYNCLCFILNDVLPLISSSSSTTTTTTYKQYLEKFKLFFEKQLGSQAESRLNHENDESNTQSEYGHEDDRHMLKQLCLDTCHKYNILTKSTSTFKANKDTTSNDSGRTSTTTTTTTTTTTSTNSRNPSGSEQIEQEEQSTVFDDIETEMKRILMSKNNSSSSAFSSMSQSNNSAAAAAAAALSPGKDFTSIEYIFKELHPYTLAFESKETELNWKKRQIFILKLRSFISYSKIIKSNKQIFLKNFKDLNYLEYLNKSINSLRTTLSINSCLLIKDLCFIFQKNIDQFQEYLFDILKPLLSSTKKITVNNAHITILSLLSYCSFSKKNFINAFNLSRDKNLQPKLCSCDYLRIYIIKSTIQQVGNQTPKNTYLQTEDFINHLKIWIKNLITNPQSLVRSYCKTSFWYFYKVFPDIGYKILNSLNPQIRKSFEMDIPRHLNLQLQYMTISNTANVHTNTSSTTTSSGSRLNKFKASSQPPYSMPSYANNNSHINIQSHEHVSRSNLRAHSDSMIQKTPTSTSAMGSSYPLHNSTHDNRMTPTSSGSSLARRNIRSFVDNDGHNSVIKKTMSESPIQATRQFMSEETVLPQDPLDICIQSLKDIFQERENTIKLEDKLKNICMMVGSLKKENEDKGLTEIQRIELIKIFRSIMLKHPSSFHQVLRESHFTMIYAQTPPMNVNHLIELYAINNDSKIANLFNVCSTVDIFQCMFEDIFNHGMTTDLNSSIFYVKYRKTILNYCLRSCVEIIETDKEVIQGNKYQVFLLDVFKLYGKDFNEEIYFELINLFYEFDSTLFINALQRQPKTLQYQISEGLQQKHGKFDINLMPNSKVQDENSRKRSFSELESGSQNHDQGHNNKSSTSGHELIDLDDNDGDTENRAMEFTMVQPWKQLKAGEKQEIEHNKEQRINSTGSVVLHNLNENTDTMKLSELTRIIPYIHKKGQNESNNQDAQDEDSDVEDIVDMSDIFEPSHAETLSPVRITNGSIHIDDDENKSSSLEMHPKSETSMKEDEDPLMEIKDGIVQDIQQKSHITDISTDNSQENSEENSNIDDECVDEEKSETKLSLEGAKFQFHEDKHIYNITDFKKLEEPLRKSFFKSDEEIEQTFTSLATELLDIFPKADKTTRDEFNFYLLQLSTWMSREQLEKAGTTIFEKYYSYFDNPDRKYVFDDKTIMAMEDTVALIMHSESAFETFYFIPKDSSDNPSEKILFALSCLGQAILTQNVTQLSHKIVHDIIENKLTSESPSIRKKSYMFLKTVPLETLSDIQLSAEQREILQRVI